MGVGWKIMRCTKGPTVNLSRYSKLIIYLNEEIKYMILERSEREIKINYHEITSGARGNTG